MKKSNIGTGRTVKQIRYFENEWGKPKPVGLTALNEITAYKDIPKKNGLIVNVEINRIDYENGKGLINEPIIARIFKRTFIRTHNLGKDSWDEYKYIFYKKTPMLNHTSKTLSTMV